MAIAIPIVAALVGAVAATALAHFFRRSRPALIIDELSRLAEIAPLSIGVAVNSDLVTACKESEFVASRPFSVQRDSWSEKDYITAVESALEDVENAIKGLPAVTEVARTLSDCLQREDYDGFLYQFSRDLWRLWRPLLMGRIRGEFTYQSMQPVPLLSQEEDQPSEVDDRVTLVVRPLAGYEGVTTAASESGEREYSHPEWSENISEDREGDFWIPLEGPANVLFQWKDFVSAAQALRGRAFAMRTAVSFASRYVPDLRDIANFLLSFEQRKLPELESLELRLRDELRQYERVVIKGFVANKGGSPVTVTDSGRLFVALYGYSFTDEHRALKSIAGDHEIDMCIGAERDDEDPAFGSAITVDAGGVSRFVAVSRKRIKDLPDAGVVMKAFTGGERECYLGTMVVSQGSRLSGRRRTRSQFRPTYTAPRPFRDSADEVQVPPRRKARHHKSDH